MQKFAALALLVACLAVAAEAANSTHPANGTHHAPSHHKSHTYHFKVALAGNGTKANGKVSCTVDLKKDVITGTIFLKNIADMTMAHFHVGAKGVDGPVAAWIYPANKAPLKKPVSIGRLGATLKFIIRAKDIVPTPTVKDFNGFIAAVKKHGIYANVHTVAKPAGEVRGQTF